MNWEAIGAIAESLGAVGVITTLAYLAQQIRQNTSTVRTSASSAIRQTDIALNTFLAQDADVNRIRQHSTIGYVSPAKFEEMDQAKAA